jgi:hypothetical protein
LTQREAEQRFPPRDTSLSPAGDFSGVNLNHTLLANEFVKWEAECGDPQNTRESLIEAAAAMFKEILGGSRSSRIYFPTQVRDVVVAAEAPLRATIEGLRADLLEVRTDLSETRSDLSRALKLAGGVSGSGSGQPKPEPFTGEREKLRSFLAQLRLQCAPIADVQDKLRRAVSLLRGDALSQILPYIKDDRVELVDLAALIQILEDAFGNPNRKRDAEAHLARISQGEKDFSSYFAEFQRYSAEVDWNESAKLSALQRGLSPRLKQDLVSVVDEPTGFKEWVELCQKLDNRRRAFLADRAKSLPSGQQSQGRQPQGPVRPAAPVRAPAQSTAVGTHPGPMDLSAAASKRKEKAEEMARRRREGLCLYCGGVGHFASKCPNKAQLRAAAAALKAAEESANDSGN